MDIVRDLAKAIRDLDRAASRYEDEELESAVRRVMEELGVVVGALGKLAAIYEELEVLVKGILRLDSASISEVELEDGEEIGAFINKCEELGVDHNKVLAYLLGSGRAKLEADGGRIRLRIAREDVKLAKI